MSVLFVFLLTLPLIVDSHPQCLDYRPPFKSERSRSFCPQYAEFGCCSNDQDNSLHNRYRHTISKLDPDTKLRCEGYIREILCQTCSPYAAHLFDAEATLKPRIFPGLCSSYCEELHKSCHEAISLVSEDEALLTTLNSSEVFCAKVSLTDVDYCYPELLTNPIFNKQISIPTVNEEGCLCLEEFAQGLRNPILARHAGDGTGRLFIAEQPGIVYVYHENKTKVETPFLNLTESVLSIGVEGDERGFLGMAFHPNFKLNGRFFIYYSYGNDSGQQVIRVSEMMVQENDVNVADRDTEQVLVEVEQPFWNHNGGEILFGDDGYLYIFVGDGGSAGDPQNNAQNMTTLLGKILRIDVDHISEGKPYAIPRDNPFVGEKAKPEIYAYGVRNIWRCGKDAGDRITGDGRGRIICGDVGQSAYEELDIVKKGVNYGWRGREGFECYDKEMCGNTGWEELPIFSYPHSVGKSVTGGQFYRGCQNPNLNGFYIYGDYFTGRLFRLMQDPFTQKWNNTEQFMCGPDYCLNGLLSKYEPNILSFGEDEQGEVYMLTTDDPTPSTPNGKVYKIVDPVRRGNPDDCSKSNLNQQPQPATPKPPLRRKQHTPAPKLKARRQQPHMRIRIVIKICKMVPRKKCTTHIIKS